MKYHLLQLSARIRAICILLALFLVPDIVQATDYYLVGGFNSWTTSDTYKFNVSGNSATLSLTGAQINATSTQFLILAVESSSNSWYLKNNSATTVTVDGNAVVASSANNNCQNCDYTVSGLSTSASTTYTFTLTANGTDINDSKLTITSNTTGGGSSTPTNQPGIYLYGGSDFGTGKLTYKFLRKNDNEYHFALYAGYMQFSVEKYEQNRTKTDITPSWNGRTFQIAYIDADGNKTVYSPSTDGYTLTGDDKTAGTEQTFGTSSNTWKIQDNGGMYDLVVKVDANGKPTNWYYQSDPNRLVSYKASSTSNWTTEGFLYCVKANSTEATGYCKNFFGTIPMVKNEEFKFITGNYWLGARYDTGANGTNVGIGDAPNLKNPYDGIYPIEYNLDRTDYQLAENKETPLRIFMIGSALNSSLGDEFTKWNPADATELVYDPDEQCYKGTVTLAKNGQFRFLRDIHSSGPATTLELNFGEDGNAPGKGGDTDFNNYVAYNSTSSNGNNVVFNPETNIYNVRFYIEAGTAMSSFNWNSAKYRYTIELPARLNATITPPTATVNYAASLTPKVGVVGTTAEKRKYAFTIDGSDPTIDAAGNGKGSTVVKDYDYDPVVPTSDVYTFYMSPTDQLTYIDFDKNEHTLNGNTVTVKAQAVKTNTDGTKRLEGDIATGTYVFKTAGIKPTGSYTISVTNDNQTDKPSINKVKATVKVENKATGKDDGVDVYYTIDGSDPAKVGNAGARLVNKDRKINVYGIVNLEHNAKNYIRVAIAGSKPLGDIDDETTDDDVENGTTHASCKFDLTCSTSEGEYKTYRENETDQNLKTYGGDGHIVVYIMPWSSKYLSQQGYIWVQNALDGYRSYENLCENGDNESRVAGLRVPFIYAYENFVNNDGVVESKALTHSTHTIDVFTDVAEGLPTIPNQEEPETYPPYCWYYVDLVPDKDYKEVNVEVGYYDLMPNAEIKWAFTPATIANVHNDMFLMFDVATGQIEDVTYEFTGEHFYTTGEGGTKSELANPTASKPFFYVQVPEAWTINGNSVKVLKDDKVYTDAKVEVQPSAETSSLSKVCKISVPAELTKGTQLTIQPYHGETASGLKWTINYVNGGYYFYESATHNTTDAQLVFSADADGVVKDQRPYGHRDINHTLETTPGARVKKEGCSAYGDFTYYLSPHWKDASDKEVPTTTVTDNWNGESATVNTIAKGTTISQTVDLHTAGQGLYTVQMIVRGEKNAKATLQLEGSDFYGEDESVSEDSGGEDSEGDDSSETEPTEQLKLIGNKSASDTLTFAGYDAQGTVTTDGYVEHLLKTDTKNGWQKLETTASVGSEGKLTISLKAEGGELQLSDVTLLCNANTHPEPIKGDNGNIVSYYYYPTIWTKAPTDSTVTEYDLTDRHGANEFSFFDRGENLNAVIYADKNTVLGMSKNTYNVAVPTGYKPDNNSDESPAKGGIVFHNESPGDQQTGLPFENATGHHLEFYDKPDAWDNEHTWGTSAQQITWDNFSWNRKFLGMSANSGKRNTIFLPFAMSNDQITAIFGTDAKIYKITSVNTKDLTVTGTPVTQTKPNVPYILELPETTNATDGVSYDVADKKLITVFSKFDSKSTDIKSTDTDPTQGQFVGVYKYTNITTDKYEEGYDYYCYDAERGGKFNFFSKNGASFKPFRAYLKINKTAGSKPFYYFVVDEGGTTGIDGVSTTTLTDDAPVYNLQGQLVRHAGQHTQLSKGLYIQKGRKFVQQ